MPSETPVGRINDAAVWNEIDKKANSLEAIAGKTLTDMHGTRLAVEEVRDDVSALLNRVEGLLNSTLHTVRVYAGALAFTLVGIFGAGIYFTTRTQDATLRIIQHEAIEDEKLREEIWGAIGQIAESVRTIRYQTAPKPVEEPPAEEAPPAEPAAGN